MHILSEILGNVYLVVSAISPYYIRSIFVVEKKFPKFLKAQTVKTTGPHQYLTVSNRLILVPQSHLFTNSIFLPAFYRNRGKIWCLYFITHRPYNVCRVRSLDLLVIAIVFSIEVISLSWYLYGL